MKLTTLLLLLATLPVNAQNYYPFILWTTPAGETGREDNTPLLSEEIQKYRVYREIGINTGTFETVHEYPMTLGLEQQHYTLVRTTSDTTCYVVTTIDSDGRESAYSNRACYAWPNPPNVECTIIPQ